MPTIAIVQKLEGLKGPSEEIIKEVKTIFYS